MSQDKPETKQGDPPTVTPEEATYRMLLNTGFEPEMLTALLADEAYTKPMQEARTLAILGRIAETDPYAALAALRTMRLDETTTQVAHAAIATLFADPDNRYGGGAVSKQLTAYCMKQAGDLGTLVDRGEK